MNLIHVLLGPSSEDLLAHGGPGALMLIDKLVCNMHVACQWNPCSVILTCNTLYYHSWGASWLCDHEIALYNSLGAIKIKSYYLIEFNRLGGWQLAW